MERSGLENLAGLKRPHRRRKIKGNKFIGHADLESGSESDGSDHGNEPSQDKEWELANPDTINPDDCDGTDSSDYYDPDNIVIQKIEVKGLDLEEHRKQTMTISASGKKKKKKKPRRLIDPPKAKKAKKQKSMYNFALEHADGEVPVSRVNTQNIPANVKAVVLDENMQIKRVILKAAREEEDDEQLVKGIFPSDNEPDTPFDTTDSHLPPPLPPIESQPDASRPEEQALESFGYLPVSGVESGGNDDIKAAARQIAVYMLTTPGQVKKPVKKTKNMLERYNAMVKQVNDGTIQLSKFEDKPHIDRSHDPRLVTTQPPLPPLPPVSSPVKAAIQPGKKSQGVSVLEPEVLSEPRRKKSWAQFLKEKKAKEQ